MRRAARAVRAQPLLSGCLATVAAAVTAGAACVVAFGASASWSASTIAALAGIALVAVLATAMMAVGALRAQSADIAMAEVRGIRGPRMWRWLAGAPTLTVVLGSLSGVVVAAIAMWAISAGGREPERVRLAAAAGIGAGLVCVLTAAGCCVLAPGIAHRSATPGQPPTWLAAAEVAALVGAGWLLYQAARAQPGQNALLTSLTPLASGLAAAVSSRQIVRMLGWLGTRVLPRSVSGLLAARRLRATAALTVSLGSVSGVLVVLIFATTAQLTAAEWRQDAASITTGGVTAYTSDRSAVATMLATRRADPNGRWLMTIVGSATDTDQSEYRGYADLARWERVIGSAWDDSTGIDTSTVGAEFGRDSWRPVIIPAGEFRLRADNRLRWPRDEQVFAILSLLDQRGRIVTASARIRTRKETTLTGTVGGCARGCVLRKISFGTRGGAPVRLDGEIVLRSMEVDGDPVETRWASAGGRQWSPDLVNADANGEPVRVRRAPGGLEVRLNTMGGSEPAGLVPSDEHLVRRVLVAGDTSVHGDVLGLDPSLAPGDVVATYPMLPVLGTHGYLGNLPDVVLDSAVEPPGSRVRVLARDDTPGHVRDALSATGIRLGEPVTPDDVTTELAESTAGRGAFAWILLAAVVAVVGVGVAVHSEATARARTRRDAASLRVAHVPCSAYSRSIWYQVAIVSVAAAVPAGVVGVGTWWCVRNAIVLAEPRWFEPAVDVPIPWVPAVLAVVLAFVLSAAGVLTVRRRDTVRGRPEILRRTGEPR